MGCSSNTTTPIELTTKEYIHMRIKYCISATNKL